MDMTCPELPQREKDACTRTSRGLHPPQVSASTQRGLSRTACPRKQLHGWSSNSSKLWLLGKKEKKPFPARPISRTSVHRAGLIEEAEKGPGPTRPSLLQGPGGRVENLGQHVGSSIASHEAGYDFRVE